MNRKQLWIPNVHLRNNDDMTPLINFQTRGVIWRSLWRNQHPPFSLSNDEGCTKDDCDGPPLIRVMGIYHHLQYRVVNRRFFYFKYMKKDEGVDSCWFLGPVIYILYLFWHSVIHLMTNTWNPVLFTVPSLKGLKRKTEYRRFKPWSLQLLDLWGYHRPVFSGLFPDTISVF